MDKTVKYIIIAVVLAMIALGGGSILYSIRNTENEVRIRKEQLKEADKHSDWADEANKELYQRALENSIEISNAETTDK